MNKNTAHTQHTQKEAQRHKSTKIGNRQVVLDKKKKHPHKKKNRTGNRGKVKAAEEGEVVLNHANKWRLRCIRFRVYMI